MYEEDEAFEDTITEEQAARLVKWVMDHGHTKEEAHEALAYVMNATGEESVEE